MCPQFQKLAGTLLHKLLAIELCCEGFKTIHMGHYKSVIGYYTDNYRALYRVLYNRVVIRVLYKVL